MYLNLVPRPSFEKRTNVECGSMLNNARILPALRLIVVNLVGWFFVIFVMFYYAVRSLWRAMIFLIIVLSIWIRNDAVTAKIKMNLNAGK